MGVSSSPAELSRKLIAFADDLGKPEVALNATALFAKRTFEGTAASAGVLGHRVARGKIGVRYDIKGAGRRAVALIRYTGPAHLVNNPTRPHRIEPRGRRGRRRGRNALAFDGGVFASANHPGTAGKGFFQAAARIVRAQAPRVFAKTGLTVPLKRHF